MDEPLISVIIPVYKVEKYLRRCLESVRDQSYRNLEVIVVDDGSPDKCPRICDSFATSDKAPPPRFKIIHQKNGGVDVARNAGLDAATGEFVTFADSDDWLPRDAVRALYERMRETGADVVFGNYKKVQIRGALKRGTHGRELIDATDRDALANFLEVSFGVNSVLFRKRIIEENKLRFPLDMSGQRDDTFFALRYLQCCKLIATIPESVYYYNDLVDTSITRSRRAVWMPSVRKTEELRSRLFEGDEVPLVTQKMEVSIFQYFLLRNADEFTREEGTEIIREGYEQAKGFLGRISPEVYDKYPDDEDLRFYRKILPLLDAGDCGAVYDLYLERRQADAGERRFKRLVRKILLRPEQFVLFRLRWFYKN